MPKHQSMSARLVQKNIDRYAQQYGVLIRDELWSLEYSHIALQDNELDLFQIAGLAKAIACYQYTDTEVQS